MENPDFEMPSPKRQKTDSPPQAHAIPLPTKIISTVDTTHGAEKEQDTSTTASEIAVLTSHDSAATIENVKTEEKDMLDVLMQHVESEAASRDTQPLGPMEQQQQQPTDLAGNAVKIDQGMTKDTEMDDAEPTVAISQPARSEPTQPQHIEQTAPMDVSQGTHITTSEHDSSLKPHDLPAGLEPTSPDTIDHLRTVAETNNLPPTSDTLASDHTPSAIEAVQSTNESAGEPAEPREWETDSSPYESSSSDDTSSDSDSSDDDEDDDEEYTLLNPYEQAAILMADGGDDNSDDEGRRGSTRANAGLRTVNEKPEEILPKPNIAITESMHIEELGSVQAIVENTVLITAKTSGEYRVLESNSLLCTATRLPIGVVAETLGRVEAPLYTVRFASEAEIKESGVNEKGTKIYYVHDHSTFVFTQPLKAVKGSDASNFHDEEVGDDEMEFSDDEAEAEHKRQAKLKKKGIDPASIPAPSRGGRGGRGQRSRGGRGGISNMHAIPESDTASAYGTTSIEMNYDDMEEGETEYTPLRRPETMAQTSPHSMYTNGSMSPPQPHSNFNPRNDQDSRGTRGSRGRGNPNHSHNSRGRGRGGNHAQNQNHNQNQFNRTPYNQTTKTNTNSYSQNNYSPSSSTSMYANSSPQQQSQPQFHTLPPPPPPPAPYLTPSSGPYNTSGNATPTGGIFTVPPSPMTPLPGGHFNFGFNPGQYQVLQHQSQSQGQTQTQAQAQAQAQAQGQWAQYHANLNQYQQQYGGYGNASTNADAIAQVQRTLEQLRRAGNSGSGANGWNGGLQ